MSTMNIAIVGGVVLLLLVLIKMRRDAAHDSPAPTAGRGRSERRSRRRGKGRNVPPAPPEPMPLAAAGQSAAPSAEYEAPPVAEWPPAPEPGPAAWPPVEDEPVAAAPAPDAAIADAPAPDEGRDAASPYDEVPAGWPEDELVTEPGWPMPGEVDDLAWSGSGTGPMPSAPPVASQPVAAWAEQAATAAPPAADLEWMSPEPAADEPEAWAAPAPAEAVDESSWPTEAPGDAAGIPAWEPQIEAVDEIAEDAWPVHDGDVDAQLTGEIPVVPAPEEATPSFEDMPADPFADVDGIVFGDGDPGYAAADVPEIAFAPEPEDVAPEVAAEPEPAVGFSFDPEAGFEPEADFVPEAGFEPEVDVALAPVAVAPATADVPWWDEEPEPVAAAPVERDDPALTGRFALGGFALQAGQHALGGVSFRSGLDEAPTAWAVAPADDAAPGTLVLSLEGAINCAPEGLAVVTDEGFAPTTEGFTVRVEATTAGPFAASGTFRVR